MGRPSAPPPDQRFPPGAASLPERAADDLVGVLLRAHAVRSGAAVATDATPGRVWAALRAAGDPAPGLAFAAQAPVTVAGGPLVPLLANSATAGELLERLVAFHPLFGEELLRLRSVPGAREVHLTAPDGGPAHPDTVDACFALLARVLADLTGGAVRPARVTLRRSATADPAPWTASFGGARIALAAADDACVFAAPALTVPLPGADPELARIVEPYARRRVAERDASWAGAVLAALGTRAQDGGTPTVAAVARELAVGVRTLQERLAAEGTTFSELAERTRRESTLALLAGSDVLLTTVAARVGFATPAALTRAVRRWTGLSPSQYRRSRGA